ncbi:MAG: alanine--tRNA ligase, partial [Firmicutes bacterium]|nr:alanine--tRNA ligase [Bacillota bacterium]
MKYMGLNELREKYLSFFESKGHLRMDSASLIPNNDKSLLLINSGMAPLKPFFTGQQIPPRKRVTTCQKCIRTGDIENVGKTARHGTFFEMLGNFSFGDYFKEEAIEWAWEFFTKVLELPEERLYVSIYQDDDEAFEIWNKKIGLDESRIFRMGKEDNFWEHGLGPCGPCSEIYYDKGEKYGCGSPTCTVGCDCDRYMEVWNLVFTQFCKQEDGSYPRLDHPNIDTGLGLERIATVMQNVDSIFDVDTVKAVRDAVCKLANVKYNEDHKKDISIRVITDHIRSVAFMTADGVTFSNEGRGYVLRRLLRRAARHGKLLGINKKFLADMCKVVIETSKDAYPQLEEKREYILKSITVEEDRFYATLEQGLEILRAKINELKENTKSVLSGEDSFKLYDTYGFPLDLMEEILEEANMTLDEGKFREEMEKQKTRARSAREEYTYMGADETVFHKLDPAMSTEFVGYDDLTVSDCKVLAVISGDEIKDSAAEGEEVVIIADKTPFYAEMGGQKGDCGIIRTSGCEIEVEDCTKFGGNKFLHHGTVKSGKISVGETAEFAVDKDKRIAACRNHTATHLLQKALREVLGSHVEQKGSLVSPTKLRFDFSHFEPISAEDLALIERKVNEKILEAIDVETSEKSMDEAKKMGATALFDEKYGDVVRVVNIGGYSIELCGGTHLKNTAQAGSFKILTETGISAGTRRIEALTGFNVLDYVEQKELFMSNIGKLLKSNAENIINKISSLIAENKSLTKELESLKAKLSNSAADGIMNNKVTINDVDIICAKVNDTDMNGLRNMGDSLKAKLDTAVIILAAAADDKVNFVVMATDT